MKTVKIEILDSTIPVLKYVHPGDAGLNLYSAINYKLKPFERKKIPTGIKISIPHGYAGVFSLNPDLP